MNTNAEDRDINQVNRTIAEWMGTHCFDEVRIEETGGMYFACRHCQIPRFGHPADPDYTSSLDAVAEAEKKAVIEFGLGRYGARMWKLSDSVGTTLTRPEEFGIAATTSALARATAIFNLITESRALEVK